MYEASFANEFIERFSFERRKVIGFAITMPHDWLKKLAPHFHPIRSKTKTNRDSLARVFPRFASATCNYYEFWLAHCNVYGFCDWLEWLLWFWFYDAQLKTALTHTNLSIIGILVRRVLSRRGWMIGVQNAHIWRFAQLRFIAEILLSIVNRVLLYICTEHFVLKNIIPSGFSGFYEWYEDICLSYHFPGYHNKVYYNRCIRFIFLSWLFCYVRLEGAEQFLQL